MVRRAYNASLINGARGQGRGDDDPLVLPRPDRKIVKTELLQKIVARDAIVAIIGLGYVGLPLLRAFHGGGYRVIGFDVDEAKVSALNAGRSYLKHIPSSEIETLRADGRFHATADFSELAQADAILICVPTPLTRYREPYMSYVRSTAATF